MVMLPYRLRQVWHLLRRAPQPEELAWMRTLLTPPQQALFLAQQPGDQAHALVVARSLQQAGQAEPRLLRAALLHDVGKAPGIPLAYRTLLVLLKRVAPGWLRQLSATEHGWLAPLARAVHHPELGAELVERAGSEAEVVALVRYHQNAQPPLPPELLALLRALQQVDDAH